MSLEEKKDKPAALKLSSASFVPKNLKKKTETLANSAPPAQAVAPSAPNGQMGLGVLPIGIQEKTPEKNANVMPFPSLLGGTPPMGLNGMAPLVGGPMKPPPLLFSHPDNVSILPLLNSANTAAPKVKKEHLRYSVEVMMTMKDQ